MSDARFIDDEAHRSARLAISQLFLDTERDELDLKSIARELLASGLPVDELQRIHDTEVAPACWRNLRALPGGVWTGFDAQSLHEAIRQHWVRNSIPTLWQRWSIRRRCRTQISYQMSGHQTFVRELLDVISYPRLRENGYRQRLLSNPLLVDGRLVG
ncbi:hypothetical protein CDL60_02940 [Roseateles noduli]|nr:hypothetical protein CDL60_02940 [Roseateles noduli]